jgi:two-component system CheB/CheR fusion protein
MRGLVLVADDNSDAGWGMAKLLERAGFTTLRAQDGAGALEAIRRHKPDAAVLDLGMPEVDGHEVARQVRADASGARTVLIAVTGWGQESDERESMRAGFDAHLTKPVGVSQLVALIDSLLDKKRG